MAGVTLYSNQPNPWRQQQQRVTGSNTTPSFPLRIRDKHTQTDSPHATDTTPSQRLPRGRRGLSATAPATHT